MCSVVFVIDISLINNLRILIPCLHIYKHHEHINAYARFRYGKAVLVGRQSVRKFRSPDAPLDAVLILLLCLRLPSVGTDVLVTINTPVAAHEAGSALVGGDISLEDLVPPYKQRTEKEGRNLPYAVGVMKMVCETFSIQDWSLFA